MAVFVVESLRVLLCPSFDGSKVPTVPVRFSCPGPRLLLLVLFRTVAAALATLVRLLLFLTACCRLLVLEALLKLPDLSRASPPKTLRTTSSNWPSMVGWFTISCMVTWNPSKLPPNTFVVRSPTKRSGTVSVRKSASCAAGISEPQRS